MSSLASTIVKREAIKKDMRYLNDYLRNLKKFFKAECGNLILIEYYKIEKEVKDTEKCIEKLEEKLKKL